MSKKNVNVWNVGRSRTKFNHLVEDFLVEMDFLGVENYKTLDFGDDDAVTAFATNLGIYQKILTDKLKLTESIAKVLEQTVQERKQDRA